MPVSPFTAKVFVGIQTRALTASKPQEAKSNIHSAHSQEVSKRIKYYVHQVVKQLKPDPTVFNGDEAINQNITFMGAGAVFKKEKLHAGNLDMLEDMLLNTAYEAGKIITKLPIVTKERSQSEKALTMLMLGFGAVAVGSLAIQSILNNYLPSPAPKGEATTATPPQNKDAALIGLFGGYACSTTVLYIANKKIRTNKELLTTISIIAAAVCFIKQAPQYQDKIIQEAGELLYKKVGAWANQFGGWHKAVLSELGLSAELEKSAKTAAPVIKQSSDKQIEVKKLKEEQRKNIMASRYIQRNSNITEQKHFEPKYIKCMNFGDELLSDINTNPSFR